MIEVNTFEQVINLSPEHILDLIETVGVASLTNLPLMKSKEDKIATAFIMLHYANLMLEQCHCKIYTVISNPEWKGSTLYDTTIKEEYDEQD